MAFVLYTVKRDIACKATKSMQRDTGCKASKHAKGHSMNLTMIVFYHLHIQHQQTLTMIVTSSFQGIGAWDWIRSVSAKTFSMAAIPLPPAFATSSLTKLYIDFLASWSTASEYLRSWNIQQYIQQFHRIYNMMYDCTIAVYYSLLITVFSNEF